MNLLQELKKYSIISADTGDYEAIKKYAPLDVTTNPSLILASYNVPHYKIEIEQALNNLKNKNISKQIYLQEAPLYLMCAIGKKILGVIEGRVSNEVDPNASFDKEKTIEIAHKVIENYHSMGISKERILIKVAATWEGIQACKTLEREGIHCNITLVFSDVQAKAAADAGATLISPFVGRIYDWYKSQNMQITVENDPGVLSVKNIFYWLKSYHYPTQIMGASFRNIGQILELAGLDLLTIAPSLLEELNRPATQILNRKLDQKQVPSFYKENILYDRKKFSYDLNFDAMASSKLYEGIRKFAEDLEKLQKLILS